MVARLGLDIVGASREGWMEHVDGATPAAAALQLRYSSV
jgi:hypothetical protein